MGGGNAVTAAECSGWPGAANAADITSSAESAWTRPSAEGRVVAVLEDASWLQWNLRDVNAGRRAPSSRGGSPRASIAR